MFLAIHHVQLAMPRGKEAEAVRFYRDVLGFERVEKPEVLAKRGGVWFQSGQTRLHLGVEDGFVPARKAHPGFLVSDLDGLIGDLAVSGIDCQADTDYPGFRRVYIHDPFGNRIELMQEN